MWRKFSAKPMYIYKLLPGVKHYAILASWRVEYDFKLSCPIPSSLGVSRGNLGVVYAIKTHRTLKRVVVALSSQPRIKASQHAGTNNILKKPDVDPKCRLCGRFDEINDHLVSGCPELAKTEYIHRHNKAAAHMQWKICNEFGIEVKKRWYDHEPKTVTENDSVIILWDMPIHTDRTIEANRPDIVLKNRKDKTCLLIDMTVTLDTNTSVNTKTWKSRLSECGASKQQQSRWLWEPLAPSRATWKTTPTKSLATSTCMNSRK